MSRRMLNTNLGNSKPDPVPVIENPFDLVMNTPKPVQKYVPKEPIFLTKEMWDQVCSQTHDASTPFTVTITVKDNEDNDTVVGDMDNLVIDEKEDEPYVPKRTRKTKK